MKMSIKNSFTVISMSIFWLILSFSSALSQDNIARAKIGIQINSKNKNSIAKSRDRLKPGDLLRIYVHSEKPSYIYVIYSDKKTATLLNMVEQKILSSTLVLPSFNKYYAVNGENSFEMFTIICSPTELPEIDKLLNSDDSYEKWATLEKELILGSKMVLTEKSTAPFAIAGNVRGDGDSEAKDSFMKELHIFSGQSFVVKQYEFRVKK